MYILVFFGVVLGEVKRYTHPIIFIGSVIAPKNRPDRIDASA